MKRKGAAGKELDGLELGSNMSNFTMGAGRTSKGKARTPFARPFYASVPLLENPYFAHRGLQERALFYINKVFLHTGGKTLRVGRKLIWGVFFLGNRAPRPDKTGK